MNKKASLITNATGAVLPFLLLVTVALSGNTYADLLYERTGSNGNGLSPDALVPLALEIGLDEKAFDTCLESGRMSACVQEDVVEGGKIGISGTPGNIIINNETGDAIPAAGALPTETLQKIVDSLM